MTGMQHPWMAIRLPPPSYTGQVELDEVGNLRAEQEPEGPARSSENSRGDPRTEPGTVTRGIQEPNERDMAWETMVISPRIAEQGHREELQRVQITLDPGITETTRRMAQEQQTLRTEVGGFRQDTLELRVLVERNESLLGQVLECTGDPINDRWVMRAGIEESKEL